MTTPFNRTAPAHAERLAEVVGHLMPHAAAATRQLTGWHDSTVAPGAHSLNDQMAKAAGLARQLEAMLTAIYDDADAVSRTAAAPLAC